MASKKKKVKKGFTLVEVIASILILGIIALVVVPIVRKNLDEVRMKTYKETVNEIIRTGKIYASKNSLPGKLEDPIVFICNGEACINENGDKLNFKGEIPVSGYITIDGLNDVRADYVFNGQFCANGIRGKLDVAKSCNEIDITIPKVVSITQNKRVFTIKLRDNESGIGAYCVTTTNNSDSCTWQDTNKTTVEETLTTSGTYYVFAKDKKDNISESKSFETGDVQDPTIPTSGSIGSVSGSNTTGTIQNPVSGSTDESEITYKYLVTNTNTKPNKENENFTTSLDFERTCGTLYYGWAVAEDSNGYRSEVYSLGSTQDGTDSYSEWNTCTKACGTGTQERTNSCQLVTTELSQTCNEQECCSSTNYTPSNGTWGACSKTCGTGSQTYYETRTYTSAYDGSACGVTNNVDTGVTQQCNTQDCCSKKTPQYTNISGWGTCSKTCGGGTQSKTATRTYYSDYDGSQCGSPTTVTYQTQNCNTQSCQVATIWDSNGTCAGATSCSAGNKSYSFYGVNNPSQTISGPSFTMDLTNVKTINYVYTSSVGGSYNAVTTLTITVSCAGASNSMSNSIYVEGQGDIAKNGTITVNVASLTGSRTCTSSIKFTGSGTEAHYHYASYSITRIYPTY